jgi:tetratricopeptide (TPR) repeat protein
MGKQPIRIKRFRLFFLFFSVSLFAQTSKAPYRLTLPFRTGALDLNEGVIRIKQATYRPDGSGLQVMATSDKPGLVVTVFLEKSLRPATNADLRQEWWNKTAKATPLKRSDLKFGQLEGFEIVDYRIKDFRGVPVNQRAIHAYAVDGELWTEIHISRTPSATDDDETFKEVLSSFKLVPDYRPQSKDYFGYASWFYQQKNYGKAAEYYQKTLDLEEQSPTLGKTAWFVIIDNLGMSYGIAGDLNKAKEVFEHGVAKEPEYPLFYYNLACTYAELNDLDRALPNLQKAFALRKNVLPGERMPDPKTDESFKKFWNQKQFLAVVDELPKD